MNKTAAENIAQEYYLLGQQAALEKRAGLLGKAVKGTGMAYGGMLGAGLPLALGQNSMRGGVSLLDDLTQATLNNENLRGVLRNASPDDLAQLTMLAPGILGGAAIGAGAAGKGIDKLQQLLAKSSK